MDNQVGPAHREASIGRQRFGNSQQMFQASLYSSQELRLSYERGFDKIA